LLTSIDVGSSNDDPPYTLPGPVIFWNGSSNVPICQLVREPLLGEPLISRPSDAPTISQEQYNAIELVQRLAFHNSYELGRQKGDIQFINNVCLLHARDKYNSTASSQRYLVRMFLRDPEYVWPKPGRWKPLFDKPFPQPPPRATIEHLDRNPRFNVFLHG
jgi:hypothetical protein